MAKKKAVKAVKKTKEAPVKEVPEKKEVINEEKTLHKKPTKEELEEGMQKALDESETSDVEEETKEEIEDEPEEAPVAPQEEPEYKEKFVNQAKENIILHTQNKKMNEALNEAMSQQEVTEDELKANYSDWDVMSDFEKQMAKESLINSKRFGALEKITKENEGLEKWQKQVDEKLEDPATFTNHPKLEGREDEFKLFSLKKTRRNMEFDDLAKAFLYDLEEKAPARSKGQMFETGTGGPSDKPKVKTKLTIDEAQRLRETNYNEWKKQLKSGNIESGLE